MTRSRGIIISVVMSSTFVSFIPATDACFINRSFLLRATDCAMLRFSSPAVELGVSALLAEVLEYRASAEFTDRLVGRISEEYVGGRISNVVGDISAGFGDVLGCDGDATFSRPLDS